MWIKMYMDATVLATKAHQGQYRRSSNEPYIVHPLRVASIIYDSTGDLRLATAGVCHDILEDTKITEDDLAAATNYDIVQLVKSVTKDNKLPKPEKEKEFLNRYRNAQLDTVILKLADRVDNVRDLKLQSQTFRERYTLNTMELMAATPVFGYHPVVEKLRGMITAALK